jgi:hypothetical protein
MRAISTTDAPGSPIQRQKTRAPHNALVYITIAGRTYHSSPSCPGYQRGILTATHPRDLERVRESTAWRRGKGVCGRCWDTAGRAKRRRQR